MDENFDTNIRVLVVLIAVLTVVLLVPTIAWSWTEATLSEVDVTLNVASKGESTVKTKARFVISGGKFHGFDLAPVKDSALIKEKCRAILDNGHNMQLSFKKLSDGRTRITFADKASLGRGAVTFSLIHKTDLVASGALRKYSNTARLDWTPIIWEHGTNLMSVTVVLPKTGKDSSLAIDDNVTKDYEFVIDNNKVKFTKFRTIRRYPMQLIIDFDPTIVSLKGALFIEKEKLNKNIVAGFNSNIATSNFFKKTAPVYILLLPIFVALFGFLLVMFKAWRIQRAFFSLNINGQFYLLGNTGLLFRVVLSVIAVVLGSSVQLMGFLAASVPAFAIAVSLWIVKRIDSSLRPRPGGVWRQMTDTDLHRYRIVTKEYIGRRRLWLDISTPVGIITFLLVVSTVGYATFFTSSQWASISWAIVINAVIWIIPIWFSFVISELPVDATIESFLALRRWRKGLSKLVGTVNSDVKASFWVREDDMGTIEVRLRVEPAPIGLSGLEVAAEVVKHGSSHKTRKVAILRMKPDTEAARKLAKCPHAVEHHLTPDLEEEIVVLRNRRGSRDAGLNPLRNALSLISN